MAALVEISEMSARFYASVHLKCKSNISYIMAHFKRNSSMVDNEKVLILGTR